MELGKDGLNFSQPTAPCRPCAQRGKPHSRTAQPSNIGRTDLSQSILKAHSPVLRGDCCEGSASRMQETKARGCGMFHFEVVATLVAREIARERIYPWPESLYTPAPPCFHACGVRWRLTRLHLRNSNPVLRPRQDGIPDSLGNHYPGCFRVRRTIFR
jgi:hypothetical protein